MGSHETEMKKPISSTDSIYEEEVAPSISSWVLSELVCNINIYKLATQKLQLQLNLSELITNIAIVQTFIYPEPAVD